MSDRSYIICLRSAYFEGLVAKIITLADSHIGGVQSWIRHGCREDNLMIGFDVIADCGDQPLKVLAPLLGHSFILDIVEEQKARVT